MLGGETYVLADCFNIDYAIRHDINDIVGYIIPFTMLTDSESHFNVIARSTTTTEKRLMIHVRATREAFENNEISDIGWIRTDENIADGLTTTGRSQELEDLMKTAGVLTTKVEQCIDSKKMEICKKKLIKLRTRLSSTISQD